MTLSNLPKLVLFIPCFNEQDQLPAMLAELGELPGQLEGIATLEVLIIDDGSQDASVAVARGLGYEVLERPHTGLAQTYAAGLRAALERGADLIVSLEADAQYDPAALPCALAPLLAKEADVVIVERNLGHLKERSVIHQILHHFGCWVVSKSTGLVSKDPISGYRAYSRAAAEQLRVHSKFCPMLELWVQMAWLPLRTHLVIWPSRLTIRPSRLFRSVWDYVFKQTRTLLWALWRYRKYRQGSVLPPLLSIPPVHP